MAKADAINSTGASAPLSSLIRDPFVAEAFRRAERDGEAFAVTPPRPLTLAGGSAAELEIELS